MLHIKLSDVISRLIGAMLNAEAETNGLVFTLPVRLGNETGPLLGKVHLLAFMHQADVRVAWSLGQTEAPYISAGDWTLENARDWKHAIEKVIEEKVTLLKEEKICDSRGLMMQALCVLGAADELFRKVNVTLGSAPTAPGMVPPPLGYPPLPVIQEVDFLNPRIPAAA